MYKYVISSVSVTHFITTQHLVSQKGEPQDHNEPHTRNRGYEVKGRLDKDISTGWHWKDKTNKIPSSYAQ